MYLYLARHAWAGEFGDAGVRRDYLRGLTKEGAERYAKVVSALAVRGFRPNRIATSPYKRCRQTADLIALHTAGEPVIDELPALAPGSDLLALLEWTSSHGDQDLCWVGHNPDMEVLAASLLGSEAGSIRFAKGSVAAIRFDEPIEGANLASPGTLYWHMTAKSMGL